MFLRYTRQLPRLPLIKGNGNYRNGVEHCLKFVELLRVSYRTIALNPSSVRNRQCLHLKPGTIFVDKNISSRLSHR